MKNRYAMTDTQSELCALAEKYADAYNELNKHFTDIPQKEIVLRARRRLLSSRAVFSRCA